MTWESGVTKRSEASGEKPNYVMVTKTSAMVCVESTNSPVALWVGTHEMWEDFITGVKAGEFDL